MNGVLNQELLEQKTNKMQKSSISKNMDGMVIQYQYLKGGNNNGKKNQQKYVSQQDAEKED